MKKKILLCTVALLATGLLITSIGVNTAKANDDWGWAGIVIPWLEYLPNYETAGLPYSHEFYCDPTVIRSSYSYEHKGGVSEHTTMTWKTTVAYSVVEGTLCSITPLQNPPPCSEDIPC